jgi:hypothetical protein
LKSTTFVVDLKSARAVCARFRMIFRTNGLRIFGDDHVQGHHPEWIMPDKRPAAIRPLGRARCP